MKQTLYITKCRHLEPMLFSSDQSADPDYEVLGTVEVEYEIPKIDLNAQRERKIQAAYARAAIIKTEADKKIEKALEEARALQAALGNALKEYNNGSEVTAEEKTAIESAWKGA